MFTNKKINGINATRYIMSWVRVGGQLGLYGEGIDEFRKWLRSMNLNETDINSIVYLATNGKIELEINAERFLNK